MKAIVLTFDRNTIFTEHMILCYSELWPDHPFVFRIPYQNPERRILSDNREYVLTPIDIKASVLTLLQDIDDEEWVYWCIDDKYPIELEINKIKWIYESILSQDVQEISGILFCRARRMLDPNYLTSSKIMLGKELLLERKAYHQIWIHQFVRAKVLKYLFTSFPDKITKANIMDGFKDSLIKPSTHKLFVSETNYAVFGESTSYGVITENCLQSLQRKGYKIPEWHLSHSAPAIKIGNI